MTVSPHDEAEMDHQAWRREMETQRAELRAEMDRRRDWIDRELRLNKIYLVTCFGLFVILPLALALAILYLSWAESSPAPGPSPAEEMTP